MPSIHRVFLCRKTLEAFGPAFIKRGQCAATRRHIFSPDLCTELECLRVHKCAPVHSKAHTRAAIRQAFSDGADDLFEEEVIASGSIAQVHKARLSVHTGFDAGKSLFAEAWDCMRQTSDDPT